jgi:hypothetical protein
MPPGRTIVVGFDDGSVELIDLLLVASLHFEKTRPRRSNGRRRS